MTTDVLSKSNQAGRKGVLFMATMLYLPLLPFLCMSEFAFIEHVWSNSKLAIDLFIIICLQFMILIPAVGGLIARIKLEKKLIEGEISPSYASDLVTWQFGQLVTFYLVVMFLAGIIPR
jgi:hypothetical protein